MAENVLETFDESVDHKADDRHNNGDDDEERGVIGYGECHGSSLPSLKDEWLGKTSKTQGKRRAIAKIVGKQARTFHITYLRSI
jgi:hypothetical protein